MHDRAIGGALAQRCAELAFEAHRAAQRRPAAQFALAALVLDPRQRGRRGLLSLIARSVLGSRIIDAGRAARGRHNVASDDVDTLRRSLADAPLDPQAHAQLGDAYERQHNTVTACACWRTARTLLRQLDRNTADMDSRLNATPATAAFTHDPYGRMQWIASKVLATQVEGTVAVLDVGGGNGYLGELLPDADYALVEPAINGLSGDHLPFGDRSFDIVVALHSLEHVPPTARVRVLDEIRRVSRRQVLVLGPFEPPPGTSHTEDGIFQATGAAWAREHLDNGLPILDEVVAYFDKCRLHYRVEPNSDARVMYWQYLADHFSQQAGSRHEFGTATRFFHANFDYAPCKNAVPHDFLITVDT